MKDGNPDRGNTGKTGGSKINGQTGKKKPEREGSKQRKEGGVSKESSDDVSPSHSVPVQRQAVTAMPAY